MEASMRKVAHALDWLTERGGAGWLALFGGSTFLLVSGVLRVAARLQMLSSKRTSDVKLGSATDWKYRAEGALNLVVAYCGNDQRLLGMVLRLRKRQVGSSSSSHSSCEASYAFIESLRPLVSEEVLPRGELVRLEKSFLQQLHQHCQPHRPANRLHAEIDFDAPHGLLLPDLSDLPLPPGYDKSQILSCEIKPKACVLPDAKHICAEQKIKSEVPRFTMMQFSKLKSGKVNSVSKYDPLDLFSNSRQRMRSAIKDLLQTPQNNFVVRSLGADGQSLNLTNAASRECAIAQCLNVDADTASDTLCELLVSILDDCRVLDEVKKLQVAAFIHDRMAPFCLSGDEDAETRAVARSWTDTTLRTCAGCTSTSPTLKAAPRLTLFLPFPLSRGPPFLVRWDTTPDLSRSMSFDSDCLVSSLLLPRTALQAAARQSAPAALPPVRILRPVGLDQPRA